VRLRGGGEAAATHDTAYLDPRTGATYPLSVPRWCGDGQAPLLLTDLPGITRADIRSEVCARRHVDAVVVLVRVDVLLYVDVILYIGALAVALQCRVSLYARRSYHNG